MPLKFAEPGVWGSTYSTLLVGVILLQLSALLQHE